MTNNTTKQTETKKPTNYEKLLKNLDDKDFAYEFKLKKLARAKDLIGDILAVTLGWSIITEKGNEWGQKSFLELFELITIRHKNFFVPDFIEELKHYLFTYSMKHDKEYNKWCKKSLAARGLDEYGIELEKQVESEKPIDVPKIEAKVLDVSDSSIEDLAQKLSDIMRNPNLPKPIQDCLEDNLNSNHIDFYSRENILENLKTLRETEAEND